MQKTLTTNDLALKPRKITTRRVEHLDRDNLLAQDAAAPLFRAGVVTVALTERTDYVSGMAARPYHSLTLLLQGTMSFEFGGRTYSLAPGDLACCPAGIPFERRARNRTSWWIYLQLEEIPDWEPIKARGPYVRSFTPAALMFLLLRNVLDATASREPATIAHAQTCSRSLLALLRNEVRSVGWERSRYASGLQQLVDAIARSPGERWERSRMAALLHLSVRQMTQVFREQLGVSPHELVLRQRMNRAIDLLSNTRRPIKTIAADLGYESLHSFTRLFTQHVGTPPGKYRSRINRRESEHAPTAT